MHKSFFAFYALAFAIGCGSGDAQPEPSRASPDTAGVRYAGGETTDFGNGSDAPCGTQDHFEPISRAAAEAQGFDVAGQIDWLEQPHRAALSWNPANCGVLGVACSDDLELGVEVTDLLLVRRTYWRCQSAPTQHLAYRAAIHLQTDDAQLAGTFYARLNIPIPIGVEAADSDRYVAEALPDLRNFSGSLPLRLDLERAHFAYLFAHLALSRDGTTSGFFEPRVHYYDSAGGLGAISADAIWNDGRAFVDRPVPGGASSTLSDYPGSAIAPLVNLSVRSNAADPRVLVDFTVRLDDRVVRESSAPAGDLIDLGAQPFGTRISVDVRNPNDAAAASILQDGCFVADSTCAEPGCTAHAEYSVATDECAN